jgi:plastocyanin
VLLTAVACADDGNDQAFQAQRAAELAAQYRASQTTTTAPAGSTDAAVAGAVSSPESTVLPIEPEPAVPAAEPTGVVVPVIALDNTFRPEVIEINVGDEVLWENRGMNEHNVLSVNGPEWGVEVDLFQPGDVYAHVFTEPGEYRYYCSIHGTADVGMIGTIIVTA